MKIDINLIANKNNLSKIKQAIAPKTSSFSFFHIPKKQS
jgi:hypothetical protein